MLENEMDFENRIIAPEYTSMEDSDVETSLRPKTLSEYIGQEKAKENLSIFMQSAKMRGKRLTMYCCMALRGWVRRLLLVSWQTRWGSICV